MSHRTSAEIVADSITEFGDETRLTSIYVVFPKMILGERNRHRAFSLSDRSSRAVPPEKLIEEVQNDPAMPAKFRGRAKGMGGGDELAGTELLAARGTWRMAAMNAAVSAKHLLSCDLAKEIVNRPLDPFIRMHSLMTATKAGWLNFFGLRLDSGADPTIQVLAQKCFAAYKDSKPRLLKPGQWHLPFVAESDLYGRDENGDWGLKDEPAIKLSAARCAHLSYNDLETGQRMTLDRALAIYNKLVGSSPIHASPLEHQATPDTKSPIVKDGDIWPEAWDHQNEWGNLFGWRQARKMLPGEAVAPLPEGFSL